MHPHQHKLIGNAHFIHDKFFILNIYIYMYCFFLIGLELEYEKREPNGLNFIKVHATLEVLRRYSEILKLRMPMREVTSL